VVSALFADVVGSTALGERLDPEDFTTVVGEAVRRMATVVEELGGTVVELSGDGLLALFGAPTAHEDDAERAVRAGLRVVDEMSGYAVEIASEHRVEDFSVRVGIETGLAVLGRQGAGRKVEYTAMGDALNTAARLQAAAPPGSVLVGERTHRAVEGAFEWGNPVDLRLKGKTEDVRACPVRRARGEAAGAGAAERVEAPLVGRERELAAGREALDAVAGGAGGMLFVTGEAGVGKSRLVRELHAHFQATTRDPRGLWLHGRCVSYGETDPYLPLRGVLLDWLRNAAPAEDAPVARLRAACAEYLGDAAERLEPFLVALLEEPGGGAAVDLAPEGVQERTFEAVTLLLSALAERGPLVVSLDDVHWADASTLELVESLFDLAEDAPLLVVLVARPEREHASWALRERALRDLPHRARELSLDLLDESQDRTLLDALVGSAALPPDLERRILDRAEGNPFYLEEIVRSLLDTGALVRENGDWRLDREVEVEVPDTVERLVLSRIDRLDGPCHDVLAAAAVLGRQFELSVLERIAGEGDIAGALHELERLELVRQGRRWPVPEYRFRHSLIQEAAYSALLRRRRRELHASAAAAISELHADRLDERAGVLARHHREAGNFEQAFDFHRRAADAALRIYAQEEALEHLDGALAAAAALGRGPDDAALRRLHFERGAVRYDSLGDFPGARADWDIALRTAREVGDRALEVDTLTAIAAAQRVDDLETAIRTQLESLAAARASGSPELEAGALGRLSIGYSNVLRLDAALDNGHAAMAIAEGTGDPMQRVAALDALKLAALMLGDLPRLDALCRELAELLSGLPDEGYAQRFGLAVYRSWSLLEWSYVPAGSGRWDEALARIDEGLALLRQVGFHTHEAVFLETLARLRRARGDAEAALETVDEAAARARRSENLEWWAWTAATGGWTLLDLGRVEEAIERLDAGLATARRAAAPMPAFRCAGLLAGAAAAAEGAESLMAGMTFPPGGAFLYGAHAISGTARARLAGGEAERALAIAEPALAAAGTSGWAEAEADLALAAAGAAAALGDADRSGALRERARGVADAAGLPVLSRQALAALAG
jgi:class 3 adenylate cyclase/tetratricopeptide (TPR) repeat protein